MAEIAVSFVVEKMGDMLIHKATFLEGAHRQVDRLKTELKRMQCFLKDADARQQEDESVHNWVSEIRDLAYQAEDAIDLYVSNVAEPGRTKFFPWRIIKKLVSRWKMGNQIEDIQMKIQDISRSLVTYGINRFGEATSPAGQRLQKLRYTSPLVNEDTVGLKVQTDELVKVLEGGDERRRVVSIVGMGGIGKTTLAKKVYNDSRVLQHFQSYRAWAYVSQDCRPGDIFRQILNRLPYVPTEAETRKIQQLRENELGDFLHEHLKGKRFLVVLDDIWKSEDWKCVARAFPDESNGSRLLLTTRNTEVALQADVRTPPHHMQVLSDEESWKLFCRTAIPEEDGDTDAWPPGLQEIGDKMVKKCGGLPLAIVVLGGLLSSKPRSPTVWENVLNNLQAHFASENGVDAILSLSYVDLPHNLKSCFLYLGLFPEDQVIPKRRLLDLWTAEGFVPQEEDDGQSMAEEYLNELINRNLVQAAKVSVNERVTRCRIHDLVRDLCIKKAKEVKFFEIPRFSTSPKSRRIGVHGSINRYAFTEPSAPYIRSLLYFKTQGTTMTWSYVNFGDNRFKLLRVLDLGDVELTANPLRKLSHLRYLRFYLDVRSLGEYLYLPISLQTLTLESKDSGASAYRALGSVVNIEKLKNLQHLSLSYYENREVGRPSLRIETLRNLQTLSWICLSDWLRNDTRRLTSLRKLKMELDARLQDQAAEGMFSNSIAKCVNLRSLYLEASSSHCTDIPSLLMSSWLRLSKLQMKGRMGQLPEVDEFPPSLTQLTLENTLLWKDSMAILQKLPKLVTLRFVGDAFIDNMKVQVFKDGFPQLRNLLFLQCRTDLTIAKGGMPKLTQLEIYEGYLGSTRINDLVRSYI